MTTHQYSKPAAPVAPSEEELLKAKLDAMSPAERRAWTKGYRGKARKIKVQAVPGSESQVIPPFFAGLTGPFYMRRGFEIIVPDEVVESFKSANEGTTVQCDFHRADPVSGNVPLITVPVEPRFPYHDYGKATWEEYEEFLAEQAKKPMIPSYR